MAGARAERLEQGLDVLGEVECGVRHRAAGRTLAQELVLDSGPDHLRQLQLGDALQNLQPTGAEVISWKR